MDNLHFQTLANDWLREFSLALKHVELYSAEHPRGREFLDRSFHALMKVLEGRKEVTLIRTADGLTLDQAPLSRDALMERLTATLDAAAASTVVDLAKRALVSGRRLLLRVGATKQALQVVSKDLALPLGDGPGSGDDPTVHGGSLRLRWSVGAAAAFDETYALPAASWQAISRNGVVKGYRLAPVPPFTS